MDRPTDRSASPHGGSAFEAWANSQAQDTDDEAPSLASYDRLADRLAREEA